MNKAGLWSHISWLAFLSFLFPLFAFADASFEIPYTLDSDGSVHCVWELSAYNGSNNFYSYTIAKDTRTNVVSQARTGGKKLCTGEFQASTLEGGDLFSLGEAGTYYLTLYQNSDYTMPYGYMAFDCALSAVCASAKETSIVTEHGHLTADATWTKDHNPYLVDQLTIDPGVTLSIGQGVIVKFRNSSSFIYVDSGAKLEVVGTTEDKVYFTSVFDDSLGGDTNGDGSMYLPARGDWDNVVNYGTLEVVNLESRYANHAFINHEGGTTKVDQSTITEVKNYAVLQQAGTMSITNSKILDSGNGIGQVAGQMHIFNSSIYRHDNLGAYSKSGTINAMHNYWGHATGPHLKFSNDPSGSGEDISNDVAYIPWLSAEPTENKYMGCVTDCFSNVLFLPGMMASRLYEAGEEIWFTRNEGEQNKMALNSEGKSEYTVYTKDDIRHEVEGENETGITDEVLGFNIYKSFTEDLRKWRTTDNLFEDYAFVPYDWRLSLHDIVNNGQVTDGKLSYGDTTAGGQYIIKQLEALAQNSRTGKVTIVAHSNGGLVAKYLIHKLQTEGNPLADKIDKLILVAVPQIGTPESYITLLHGVSVAKKLVMNKETSRFLAENFPVMYNLLPTDAYFSTVDTNQSPLITFEEVEPYAPQVSVYGTTVTTLDELKGYVLGTDGRTKPERGDTKHPNKGNETLYKQAQEIHAVLDNWQPPTNLKITQIAGWGEETKSNLEYVERTYLGGVKRTTFKVNTTIDGDHTVVEPSALWMSPNTNSNVERWWVDLDKFNGIKPAFRTEHKDILEVKKLRDFIKAKIDEKSFTDEEKIVVFAKPVSDKISKRLHFTLHSPLTLGIYDAEGRYSGLDPATMEVRNEIPGVYYEQIGDVQFLSIPTGIAFTLKLDGLEDGSFALDIDEQSGNSITATTIFEGIPSGADTVATIEIGQEFKVGESVLKIDKENDGTIDVTLTATPDGRTVYEEAKVEPVEEPEQEVKEETKEETKTESSSAEASEDKEETPPVVTVPIASSTSRSVVPVWMLNQPTSSPSPVVAVSTSSQEPVLESVVSEPVQTEVPEAEVLGQATQEDVEKVTETTTENTDEEMEIPTEPETETIPLTASAGKAIGIPYQKLLFVVLTLLGILLGFRFIKG